MEEAIREKLRREALLKALKDTAGILPAEEYPEWETSDKTATWVRESRRIQWHRRPRLWVFAVYADS
ncbi:MAG: hypothetical protein A2147_06940 [Chloroflexi bacterium RBG_16_57_8]|nr:MAG: hypothetical protein A2147_06940 [Chloroflexi bacterium RBG_16_57_8]